MWFLLVLVDHAEMVRVALGPLLGIRSSVLLLSLAWGWLALMIATVAALFVRPRWASVLLLLLVPSSTVLLSLSYIPFLTTLVPPSLGVGALLLGNIVVLGGSLLLLHRAPKPADTLAAG